MRNINDNTINSAVVTIFIETNIISTILDTF